MTWKEFQEIFNSKYYSKTVLDSKVNTFSNLKQGKMIVLEYVRKFDQLSCFPPNMVAKKNLQSFGDLYMKRIVT